MMEWQSHPAPPNCRIFFNTLNGVQPAIQLLQNYLITCQSLIFDSSNGDCTHFPISEALKIQPHYQVSHPTGVKFSTRSIFPGPLTSSVPTATAGLPDGDKPKPELLNLFFTLNELLVELLTGIPVKIVRREG